MDEERKNGDIILANKWVTLAFYIPLTLDAICEHHHENCSENTMEKVCSISLK